MQAVVILLSVLVYQNNCKAYESTETQAQPLTDVYISPDHLDDFLTKLDKTFETSTETIAIEFTAHNNVGFTAIDPIGRGIFDRKNKQLIRLYCLKRNEQTTNCETAQYGVSSFDHYQRDALGNRPSAAGVKPIGLVLNTLSAEALQNKIKQMKKPVSLKYPKLNFKHTIKAWKNEFPMISLTVGYFGGLGVAVFLHNPTIAWTLAGTATLIAISPTLLDISLNTAKIATVPVVLIERGLVKTLGKSSKKIANAMNDRTLNWEHAPLRVSPKAFMAVKNLIEAR